MEFVPHITQIFCILIRLEQLVDTVNVELERQEDFHIGPLV